MWLNNTKRTKLFVLHPGDEVFMVFDEYPYDTPTPIVVDPDNAYLWLKLRMIAKRKQWSVESRYAGK